MKEEQISILKEQFNLLIIF